MSFKMELKMLDPAVISKIRSSFSVNSVSQCIFDLVCNSLDAKSTSIAVRINLSNFRIQVADNGDGISKENMKAVGTRYMTNKCHSLKELKTYVNSYGFRGEALASIVDISESVNVSSRQKDTSETYSVTLPSTDKENVKLAKPRPSCGTTVTVYGFLSKLPVRRQRIVLELELEEIKRNLERLIIINPGTSFTLRNDVTGMLVLNSPKTTDVIGSFRYLHPEIDDSFTLLKVTKSKVSVDCLIHKEFVTSKKFQFTFVNKRPVLSTKLQKFISDALVRKYQSTNKPKRDVILTATKKYPVFVLNVKCPPSFVDILQNPRKSGIEFKDWNLVFTCIDKLVRSYFGDEKEIPENSNKGEEKVISRGVSQVFGAVKACAYKNQPEYNQVEEAIIESENYKAKGSDKELENIVSDKMQQNLKGKEKQRKEKPENLIQNMDDFNIDKILEDLNQDKKGTRAEKKENRPKKSTKQKRRHKSPLSNFNFNKLLDELKKDFDPSKEKYRHKAFVRNKTSINPTQNTLVNYEIQDSEEVDLVTPPKLKSIIKKPLPISTENPAQSKNYENERMNVEPNEIEFKTHTEMNNEVALPENISDKSIYSTFTSDEYKGKHLIMDMFLKSTQIFTQESDKQCNENNLDISNKSTNNSSHETILESNIFMQKNFQDTFTGINATMSVSVNVKRKRSKEVKTIEINDKISKAIQTTIDDENVIEDKKLAKSIQTSYKPELKRHKSNLSDLTKKFNNFEIKPKKSDEYADQYTILISGNVQKQPNFKFVPTEKPCDKTGSQLDMFKPFETKVCHCRNDDRMFNFAGKFEKTINVDLVKNKANPKTDLFEGLVATTIRRKIITSSPKEQDGNAGKTLLKKHDTKLRILPRHKDTQHDDNAAKAVLKRYHTELSILPGHKYTQHVDNDDTAPKAMLKRHHTELPILPRLKYTHYVDNVENKEVVIPVHNCRFKIPQFEKPVIIKKQKSNLYDQNHMLVEQSPYFVKNPVNQRVLDVCESPYFVVKPHNIQSGLNQRTQDFAQIDIPSSVQYHDGFQPKYQSTQFGNRYEPIYAGPNMPHQPQILPYQSQILPYQVQNNVRSNRTYPETYGHLSDQDNFRIAQGPDFIRNNNSKQINFIQAEKNSRCVFEDNGYKNPQKLIVDNNFLHGKERQQFFQKPKINNLGYYNSEEKYCKNMQNDNNFHVKTDLEYDEYRMVSFGHPQEILQKHDDFILHQNRYPRKGVNQDLNFAYNPVREKRHQESSLELFHIKDNFVDDYKKNIYKQPENTIFNKSSIKTKTMLPDTPSIDLMNVSSMDCPFKLSPIKSLDLFSEAGNSPFVKDDESQDKSPQRSALERFLDIPTFGRFNSKESFRPIDFTENEKPFSPFVKNHISQKKSPQRSSLERFLDIHTFGRFNSKESFRPTKFTDKGKPLSSVLEISLPSETEKQEIFAKELEDNKLKNADKHFLERLSNVPTTAENSVTENVLEPFNEEEQSKVVIDSQNIWLKRYTEHGEKLYVNQRTGLVTKDYPKLLHVQFNFDTRRDYIPKGMSPVLKGHKEVDKSMSQNAKKKLQEFILESYDNELLVVKWENYISDDPKEFFKEIYQEKCQLFESCIPSICAEKSNKCNDAIFTFTKSLFYGIEVVGQVDKKFIAVVEKANKMLILFDQHAVHERIRLEKLLQVYKGSKAPCQENFVLFVSQNELSLLRKHTTYLSSLGLDVTFLQNGLRVKNMPLCIQEKCSSKENYSDDLNALLSGLIKEVIELLKDTRGSETRFPKIIENLINLKACRGAIKFGDALSVEECSQLLNNLSLCNLPFQCAHGRPTLTPLLNLNTVMDKKISRINTGFLRRNK